MATNEHKRVEAAPVGIFESDAGGRCVYVNEHWTELTWLGADDARGDGWMSAVAADDRTRIQRAWQRAVLAQDEFSQQYRLRRGDETIVWVAARALPIRDEAGEVSGYIGTITDITELKRSEARMAELALRDDLTGLGNRTAFYERLQSELAGDGTTAILFADVDGLKSVNDRFGHLAGDKLLVGIGQRIRGCLRGEDTVARLGGDEFGIVAANVNGEHQPIQLAERILTACGEPIDLGDVSLDTSISVGIAITADGAESVDEALGRADAAMFGAKRLGRGCYELSIPDPPAGSSPAAARDGSHAPLRHAHQQRAEIESLLARDDSILPVFQPVIEVETGAVAGHEALARFAHTTRQPPNAWFAQAHRFGLGNALEAKAMVAALDFPGRRDGSFIAVNVSPTALASREFQDALPASLEGVVLEITENELVHDSPEGRAAIFAARSRGALLAVDDAGSGYAGMKQLIRLTPDLLKLDRELIHGIHRDLARAALVESFVNYARRIRALVCAEGVEDLEDLALLAELDVAYAQGFGIARPARRWTESIGIVERICRQNQRDKARGRLPEDRLQLGLTAGDADSPARHQLEHELESLAERLRADEIYVSRFDRAGRYVELVEGRGWPTLGNRYRLDDYPTTAAVIDSQHPQQVLVSEPGLDEPETELLRAQGIRALLMLPLLEDGVSVGLLELYRRTEVRWTEDEVAEAVRASRRLGPLFARLTASFESAPRASAPVRSTQAIELVRARMGRG